LESELIRFVFLLTQRSVAAGATGVGVRIDVRSARRSTGMCVGVRLFYCVDNEALTLVTMAVEWRQSARDLAGRGEDRV
jgi:hypothetical protein